MAARLAILGAALGVVAVAFHSPATPAAGAAYAPPPSSQREAADAILRVPPAGNAESRIARTLPWSRVAKLVASCACVALRPADSHRPTVDGPGVLRLDLSQEPDAKSFAPFIQLLDAAGAEIARIDVSVEIGGAQ